MDRGTTPSRGVTHHSPIRRIAPIAITLLAVIGGFLVYLHYQPGYVFFGSGAQPTTIPNAITPGGATVIGPGANAWVNQFDPKTGQLQYRIRVEHYDPQSDGAVNVTHPQIEFFLSGGQILHVEGKSGVVRTTPGQERGLFNGGGGEPPKYGTLEDVTVKLYSSLAAESQSPNSPNLTATLKNAQFDNDQNQLFTREYMDEQGRIVPHDRVPVKLWSDDYTFDGTGLVVDWNDLDHKLKSMQVDHATKLTVYNATAFTTAAPAASAPQPPPQQNTQAQNTPPPAIAQSPGVSPATEQSSPAAHGPDRYRATFLQNVRAFQEGKPIAGGQRLRVDFTPKNSSPATNPNASAAPAPSPAAPADAGTTPATNPSSVAKAQTQTQPVQKPVDVYWDGPLTLVPIDPSESELIAPGEYIVDMTGEPAKLYQPPDNGQPATEIQASDLLARSGNSSVRFTGSANAPVLLRQTRADGAVSQVTVPVLHFSRETRVALLDGAGEALSPDPGDPKSILKTDWTKNCIVNFEPDAKNQLQISRAELLGNVMVDHPRFSLSSSDLTLHFDPKMSFANSPRLKEILAVGDANCVVRDDPQHPRGITGQRLDVSTELGADGKVYPRTVFADGAVRANKDNQSITAEHLKTWLVPATKSQTRQAETGDVDLERLEASTMVHVDGGDGSSIDGDYLQIVRPNGFSDILIKAAPGEVAVAQNKTSMIQGPEIRVNSADQTSSITGKGAMRDTPAATPDNPNPSPMTIHWTDRANLNARQNLAQIFGQINADSKAADGTLYLASSDHLNAALTDAAATRASSQPENSQFEDFDFMKSKQIQTISLLKNAAMSETKKDATGAVLNSMILNSEEIDCDMIAKHVSVPMSGSLAMEQHLPAAAGQPLAGGPMSNGPANNQALGTTKMLWDERFDYDQTKSEAEFNGNVQVAHVDDSAAQNRMLLDSDKLVVDFNPPDKNAPKAANQLNGGTTVKLMVATGKVRFVSGPLVVSDCDRVEFDPIAHLLTCSAGTLTDENQFRNGATFKQIVIDTSSNTIKKFTELNARVRP